MCKVFDRTNKVSARVKRTNFKTYENRFQNISADSVIGPVAGGLRKKAWGVDIISGILFFIIFFKFKLLFQRTIRW